MKESDSGATRGLSSCLWTQAVDTLISPGDAEPGTRTLSHRSKSDAATLARTGSAPTERSRGSAPWLTPRQRGLRGTAAAAPGCAQGPPHAHPHFLLHLGFTGDEFLLSRVFRSSSHLPHRIISFRSDVKSGVEKGSWAPLEGPPAGKQQALPGQGPLQVPRDFSHSC